MSCLCWHYRINVLDRWIGIFKAGVCIGVRGKTRNRKVSTGLYLLKGIYRSILSLIGLGHTSAIFQGDVK